MPKDSAGDMNGQDSNNLTGADNSQSPDVSAIAFDLTEAARLIEKSAISLAGEVETGQVTHLMLLSQQLERITLSLTDQ
ncbi:MAG: hypothetical protein ACRBB0_20490 [Pelagimonas sp.]|uniref:hypothetical protein n=1 Tax=Pelagimonas sp. TaxID=2073170 RepID=UPI003D6B5F1E